MTDRTDDRLLRMESALQSELPRLLGPNRPQRSRRVGMVEGEQVKYDLVAFDERTDEQRARDEQRGRPSGNIIVIIPGHAQTVDGPKKLSAAATLLSRSKIAWCIDLVPTEKGDLTEAKALVGIVRDRVLSIFPVLPEQQGAPDPPVAVTVIGWSHGGGESLWAVNEDPVLFPQVAGVCPTGLVDRQPLELISSFVREAVHILWAGLRRRDPVRLKDAWRLGSNVVLGLIRDLWRTRSPMRLIVDFQWACRKALGSSYDYPGEVVLLLGKRDFVIRWQDVFPECEHPGQIPQFLDAWRKDNLRAVKRLEFAVLDGNHLSPETDAISFVARALGWLGQLDESVAW
jgi:hypothetical protein